MKKLLSRTLRTFAIYSLFVLAASVPAYYYLVDNIWLKELDEHNEMIATRTEIELNKLQLTEAELAQSITLWNKIQPGSILKEYTRREPIPDKVYSISRESIYKAQKGINRFRGLSRIIQVHGRPYLLVIETNVEETEETVVAIALLTFIFFSILVIGFLYLNRRLSASLWKPFRSTLAKLKNFDLNSQTNIAFEPSDTLEFEELNTALGKLLSHNISVYNTQKEFTENASHELQTPLAIIRNKLDLLLQKDMLTDRQYQIIEDMNKALTRVSRININLLLLAKIDNYQFNENETIDASHLLNQSLEQLKEHYDNKNISTETEIADNIMLEGNKALIEILINNLLLNACRHTHPNGYIRVILNKNELLVSNTGHTALNGSNIFKRFAKTSGSTTGSGLGLAIIRQVCSRHHWAISYRHEDNYHIFSICF